MGCVLGKYSVQQDRKEAPPRRRRSLDVPAAADGVPTRREGDKQSKWKAINKGDAIPANVAALEIRRPLADVEQQGWPSWLLAVAGEVIRDWTPRGANTFEKLAKIGQGTYSNVYKARDLLTGKIVALKKVRFDNLEPDSVRFMAREILVLRKLSHPNVIKLEGLVTSRMSSSLYLVFEYMEHDLAGLMALQQIKFTEPQVKCFMKQLLSGLEHCHTRGVLHRDIKGSNLLIGDDGILKIADFGLATFYDPERKHPLTSRVVTLWYRPPELLLGATHYGVGVDLWSAGCILGELLAGRPLLPGRTEVEQLHQIFKLCGSPSEEYWKRTKLPNATLFKPQHPYKRCLVETLKDFKPSSLALIDTLLSIDPDKRGTAMAALQSDFLTIEPYPCEPSSLPKYPSSKELDAKLRDEESRRERGVGGKIGNPVDGSRKVRSRERTGRAMPAPEANAEMQGNVDRWRVVTQTNAKSKSEKFPPPHRDGTVGHQLNSSHKDPTSFGVIDGSFSSTNFNHKTSQSAKRVGSAGAFAPNKTNNDPGRVWSQTLNGLKPSFIGLSVHMLFHGKSFGSRR